VAPELDYKKDAWNILYGTVPLFWVNSPGYHSVFAYDWSNPEDRARLLESYRNTCKLHEQIGFEEMVNHEFVTDDRAVQRTVFGDGTEVWVNFGEKTWTLKRDKDEYILPQYGFYAKGPKIEQYRILRQWKTEAYRDLDQDISALGGIGGSERGVVTCIHTGDYLFVEGDVPGLLEASQGSAFTIRREGPVRLRINSSSPAQWVRINWRALCPDAGQGAWLQDKADASTKPSTIEPVIRTKGDMLVLLFNSQEPASMILTGPGVSR
jgi:hypothetical protein